LNSRGVTGINFFIDLKMQIVMRYAHPSEEHQFNAMKKIEAYRAATNK